MFYEYDGNGECNVLGHMEYEFPKDNPPVEKSASNEAGDEEVHTDVVDPPQEQLKTNKTAVCKKCGANFELSGKRGRPHKLCVQCRT